VRFYIREYVDVFLNSASEVLSPVACRPHLGFVVAWCMEKASGVRYLPSDLHYGERMVMVKESLIGIGVESFIC
jgi:hypothetical protein